MSRTSSRMSPTKLRQASFMAYPKYDKTTDEWHVCLRSKTDATQQMCFDPEEARGITYAISVALKPITDLLAMQNGHTEEG